MTMADHEYGNAPEPKPPVLHLRTAGHHWLDIYDIDGHYFGRVVLQWQPGVQKWCHSGDVATGCDLTTRNWRYVAPCPMPDLT